MTNHPLKQTLRRDAAERREVFHRSYGVHAAESAAVYGLNFLSVLPRSHVVALYHPINSELDPCFLANDLARKGVETALPVVAGADAPLIFKAWRVGDPLVDGAFGTRQPSDDAPTRTPDIILVPMLAFTMQGERLGYGGGFYDRSLAARSGGKAFGFAFMGQMIDDMPAQAHDQRVEAVITEKGVILCGAE